MIHQQKKEVLGILRRLKNRDFSGNTGIAVKNSTYQSARVLVEKGVSFLLTIVLAKYLLLPEAFGLYQLALSTILFFVTISEFGVNTTLVRFVSKSISLNKKSLVRAQIFFLFKIKTFLVLFTAFGLLVLARWLADSYYHKPLFLALIAGAFYIILVGALSFIYSIFQSRNNFKYLFLSEIFYQFLRITVVPIAIFFIIKSMPNSGKLTGILILLLTAIVALVLLFNMYLLIRQKKEFWSASKYFLSKGEKRKITGFIIASSAIGLSGLFFGYVDTILLGKFVSSEFVGYYRAASNLLGAFIPLIMFSSILLPIFSSMSGERLEKGFKRANYFILFISVIICFIVILLSNVIIQVLYRSEYILASPILRILAVLIILIPLISNYSSYLIARGRPEVISITLIIITILSFILNYALIFIFTKNFGNLGGITGAAIATVLVNFAYLICLIFLRRNFFK